MRQEEDFDANLAGEEETTEQAKASWFKRIKKGILTSTKDKKDAPEGLWAKCPSCKYTCTISELSESTKKVFTELEERIIKEQEVSRYWEESSKRFYKLFEQEKTKTKDYQMQLKAKETFTWQMFFVGLILGWLFLPSFFRWLWSWVKRFQPYIALVEFLKRKAKNL